MKNQNGLTLIEILGAITILSFVGVLVWSVFIQGINYSKQEMTRNQLTQEANIVITRLKSEYQTLDEFNIISEDCLINVYDENDNPIATFGSADADICYELYDGNNLIDEVISNPRIEGTLENNFNLKVYEDYSENEVIIPFRLSRLKDGR